jgi:hypothetical protein
MVLLNIVKELDAAKIYLQQLEKEVDYMVEYIKLGEPRRGGIYDKIKNLRQNLTNIEKEATKEEVKIPVSVSVTPGIAKVDVRTGIKKVVQP